MFGLSDEVGADVGWLREDAAAAHGYRDQGMAWWRTGMIWPVPCESRAWRAAATRHCCHYCHAAITAHRQPHSEAACRRGKAAPSTENRERPDALPPAVGAGVGREILSGQRHCEGERCEGDQRDHHGQPAIAAGELHVAGVWGRQHEMRMIQKRSQKGSRYTSSSTLRRSPGVPGCRRRKETPQRAGTAMMAAGHSSIW
jgi:hypothetical protein